MKDRLLHHLFNLISPREEKEFRQWLESQAGKRHPEWIVMYEGLHKAQTDNEVWHSMFPEAEYDDKKFRRIAQYLTEHIEEFIALQALQKEPHLRDLLIIREMNQRADNKLFMHTLKKAQNRLASNPQRDAGYYRMVYELETEYQHHLILNPGKKGETRAFAINQAFDTWWLHEKLLMELLNENLRSKRGAHIGTPFIDAAIAFVASGERAAIPDTLKDMVQVIHLLRGEAVDAEALIGRIRANKSQWSPDSYGNLFMALSNHFAKKINTENQPGDLQQMIRIYQWGIEESLVFASGKLPWQAFKNIITLDLRIGDISGAREHTTAFLGYLPQEVQEEALHFALAQIAFEANDFKQVCTHLESLNATNPLLIIHSRFLLIQAEYELGNRTELENPIRSLKAYIVSQKHLSKNHKKPYENRIKLISRLLHAFSKSDFLQLETDIGRTSPLDQREWLKQKVKEALPFS